MAGPDRMLPPLAAPTGPAYDDEAVARAFAQGVYAGHSPRFHVEGPTLMVDRSQAAALRLGPTAVLVRTDLDDPQLTAKPLVENALAAEGLVPLDRDTLLAAPVAIQVLGLRLSYWDLWGDDLDTAFAVLRSAVIADERQPGPLGQPGP